ncbi:hypothetical protein HMPREF1407_01680 [Helicobacter pylori GAM244Ai]|nr:hypothetical protein HMPREF1407_01680 [Helicobacter pylori GAM244Ai]
MGVSLNFFCFEPSLFLNSLCFFGGFFKPFVLGGFFLRGFSF